MHEARGRGDMVKRSPYQHLNARILNRWFWLLGNTPNVMKIRKKCAKYDVKCPSRVKSEKIVHHMTYNWLLPMQMVLFVLSNKNKDNNLWIKFRRRSPYWTSGWKMKLRCVIISLCIFVFDCTIKDKKWEVKDINVLIRVVLWTYTVAHMCFLWC